MAAEPESWSFRVTVSYGAGESATSDPITVTWTETRPNRAPVVNAQAANHQQFTGDGNAPRGTQVWKKFKGIFSDPDGDELTYTASIPDDRTRLVENLDIGLAVTNNAGEKVDLVFIMVDADDDWKAVSPALPDPLVTTVTLTATDPDGLSASVSGDWVTDWVSHPALVSATASEQAVALTFDLAVQANPAPAPAQFTVNVVNEDGSEGTIAVSGVSVNGEAVTLELASAFEKGQTVTLDYAHDDDAPLKRAAAGGDGLPSFTGQAVTPPNLAPVVNERAANHASFVGEQLAPRGNIVSKPFKGIFSDPNGDELTYTVSVPADRQGLLDMLGAYRDTWRVGVEVDGEDDWKAVSPALPDPLVTTVTLTATDPEGLSASVSGDFVTYWVSYPELVSATAGKQAVVLIFDLEVQGSLAPSSFTVNVANEDGSAGTVAVSSVLVSGKGVTLELASALEKGQTVTLDYAHDDDTPLTRAAEGGGNAPSFTGQAVELSLSDPPGAPQNFDLSVTPGSLDISATWDALDGATSYKLRWRLDGGEFEADNATTVTETEAGITVAGHGRWVVGLQGCNDAGCGPEAEETAEVDCHSDASTGWSWGRPWTPMAIPCRMASGSPGPRCPARAATTCAGGGWAGRTPRRRSGTTAAPPRSRTSPARPGTAPRGPAARERTSSTSPATRPAPTSTWTVPAYGRWISGLWASAMKSSDRPKPRGW